MDWEDWFDHWLVDSNNWFLDNVNGFDQWFLHGFVCGYCNYWFLVDGHKWFMESVLSNFLVKNNGLVWFGVFPWCEFVEKSVDHFLRWFCHFLRCSLDDFDDLLGCFHDLLGCLVVGLVCLVCLVCLVVHRCLDDGFGDDSLGNNWFHCHFDVFHRFTNWFGLLMEGL